LVYLAAAVTATRVLGQVDFESDGASLPSSTTLNRPAGLVLDNQGHLFVADQEYNRVLRFDDALAAGDSAADQVFGQADFASSGPNRSDTSFPLEPTAVSLWSPAGLAFDGEGNLWVADSDNSRVLLYSGALAAGDGPAASQVYGQPDFTTGEANGSGVSATSLALAYGVAVDASGSVYVADSGNHRLLAYDRVARTGCYQVFLPSIRR
jgi:DNA-binding beta-propeller fold protein YncE